MGFDAAWFNELRKLSQNIINQVPPSPGKIYPDMSDLQADHVLSGYFNNQQFFQELILLSSYLRSAKYKFYRYFKIPTNCEKHIINFPEGRACLGQWNIGFSADGDPKDGCVRVGIGFRTNEARVIGSHGEYQNYVNKIKINQLGFNNLFTGQLGYSEPASLFSSTNHAQKVINDYPNVNRFDDWRFFGRIFYLNNPSDQAILNNTQQFSQVAVSIFSQIIRQGFGY